MTDGLSEAKRQARQLAAVEAACGDLENALAEVYDEVFGLPQTSVDAIRATLRLFDLDVTKRG
jgi:hypothetical protein